MKVLIVFGTRPEVIKLAPVIREMRRRPRRFRLTLAATGQHSSLLDQMLRAFAIKPDVDLRIMKPNQSLPALTSRLLVRFSELLPKVRPDLVMVQGDTTSAMACSLAAFYQKIPVAHVEAGLRTPDFYQPFPEELDRRIVSQLASYHFAPTRGAAKNLLRQGIRRERILVTGNTVVDAVRLAVRKAAKPDSLNIAAGRKLILVTVHRRESFGQPLKQICSALRQIALRNPGAIIVYPVHPNPNVQSCVRRVLAGVKGIYLIRPVDYFTFLHLMKQAYLILTDSGGIQEEAPSFRKPVLVLRKVTERGEGVMAGVAKVVGTEARRIIRQTERLLNDARAYARMTRPANPYGDGRAARRIVDFLERQGSLRKG